MEDRKPRSLYTRGTPKNLDGGFFCSLGRMSEILHPGLCPQDTTLPSQPNLLSVKGYGRAIIQADL